jgi:hypothetical protein
LEGFGADGGTGILDPDEARFRETAGEGVQKDLGMRNGFSRSGDGLGGWRGRLP